MLRNVTAVRCISGHRVHLRFDDGLEGELDLAKLIRFRGVFEPLRDPAYFARVAVLPEDSTISWPNGADLDPVVLYYAVKGEPLPDFEGRTRAS